MSEREALFDARRHKEPIVVNGVLRVGRYLGTPVLAVQDEDDGFVVALYPDKMKPGRSHGKEKPFTFGRGEWWRLWPSQIEDGEFQFEPPEFPLLLEPKPVPDE